MMKTPTGGLSVILMMHVVLKFNFIEFSDHLYLKLFLSQYNLLTIFLFLIDKSHPQKNG